MLGKRENTGFRRKQIAVAAAKLIVRHGSENLTIKSLARHTKLSEAAIYRHFSSKNDIFHFLLKYVETRLLTDLSRSNLRQMAGLSDIDSLIDRHISGIEKGHGLEFQVIAEIISIGDVSLNQRTLGIINRYIAGLEAIFHRKINSEYSDVMPEAEYLALSFFTLLQGLVNIWALSGYSFDLKERFYRVWQVHRNALEQYTYPQVFAKS